jgi:hypothetical protein
MSDTIHQAKRVWTRHQNPRHACYYQQSDDAGTARCPAEYSNFWDWIEHSEFAVELSEEGISGEDLAGLNFGSEFTSDEFLAGITGIQDLSRELPTAMTADEVINVSRTLQEARRRNNSAWTDPRAIEILERCVAHLNQATVAQQEVANQMDFLNETLRAIADLLDRRLSRP